MARPIHADCWLQVVIHKTLQDAHHLALSAWAVDKLQVAGLSGTDSQNSGEPGMAYEPVRLTLHGH